jgi:hypothetical protein
LPGKNAVILRARLRKNSRASGIEADYVKNKESNPLPKLLSMHAPNYPIPLTLVLRRE